MNRRGFLFGSAAVMAATCAPAGRSLRLVALTLEPRGEDWPEDAVLEADFGDVRHVVWAAGGAAVDFVAPCTAAGLALVLTVDGRSQSLARLPKGRSVRVLSDRSTLVFWRH